MALKKMSYSPQREFLITILPHLSRTFLTKTKTGGNTDIFSLIMAFLKINPAYPKLNPEAELEIYCEKI
jgi:hypothetical protein